LEKGTVRQIDRIEENTVGLKQDKQSIEASYPT